MKKEQENLDHGYNNYGVTTSETELFVVKVLVVGMTLLSTIGMISLIIASL